MINGMDTAVIAATFANDFDNLEHFMRNVLTEDMLLPGETMADYLGRYAKCQAKFMFQYGQRVLINLLADACKKLCGKDETSSNPVDTDQNDVSNMSADMEDDTALQKDHIDLLFRSVYKWIRNHEAFEQVRFLHKRIF